MTSIYNRFKESGRLRDFLVFLVFLCIAGIFWLLVVVSDGSNSNNIKESIHNFLEDTPDSASRVDTNHNVSEP